MLPDHGLATLTSSYPYYEWRGNRDAQYAHLPLGADLQIILIFKKNGELQ